jgi:hypothetical protein
MDSKRFDYSVRQKIGDPGPISMRNMFPLHPVTPKQPESPYGAKYFFLQKIQIFSFSAYRAPPFTRLPSGSREIRPWRPILVFVGR